MSQFFAEFQQDPPNLIFKEMKGEKENYMRCNLEEQLGKGIDLETDAKSGQITLLDCSKKFGCLFVGHGCEIIKVSNSQINQIFTKGILKDAVRLQLSTQGKVSFLKVCEKTDILYVQTQGSPLLAFDLQKLVSLSKTSKVVEMTRIDLPNTVSDTEVRQLSSTQASILAIVTRQNEEDYNLCVYDKNQSKHIGFEQNVTSCVFSQDEQNLIVGKDGIDEGFQIMSFQKETLELKNTIKLTFPDLCDKFTVDKYRVLWISPPHKNTTIAFVTYFADEDSLEENVGQTLMVWFGEDLAKEAQTLDKLKAAKKVQAFCSDIDHQDDIMIPSFSLNWFESDSSSSGASSSNEMYGMAMMNQQDQPYFFKVADGELQVCYDLTSNCQFIDRPKDASGEPMDLQETLGACLGCQLFTSKVTGIPEKITLQLLDEEEEVCYPPVLVFYSLDGNLRCYQTFNLDWKSQDLLSKPQSVTNVSLSEEEIEETQQMIQPQDVQNRGWSIPAFAATSSNQEESKVQSVQQLLKSEDQLEESKGAEKVDLSFKKPVNQQPKESQFGGFNSNPQKQQDFSFRNDKHDLAPFKMKAGPQSKTNFAPLKAQGNHENLMAPMNHLGMTEEAYKIVKENQKLQKDQEEAIQKAAEERKMLEKHILLEDVKPIEQKPLTEEEKRNLIFSKMSASQKFAYSYDQKLSECYNTTVVKQMVGIQESMPKISQMEQEIFQQAQVKVLMEKQAQEKEISQQVQKLIGQTQKSSLEITTMRHATARINRQIRQQIISANTVQKADLLRDLAKFGKSYEQFVEESDYDEQDKDEILKILLEGRKLVKYFDRLENKIVESEALQANYQVKIKQKLSSADYQSFLSQRNSQPGANGDQIQSALQKMEQNIMRNAGFKLSNDNIAQVSTKIFYDTVVRHLKEKIMNLKNSVAITDALLSDDKQKYQTLRKQSSSKVGIFDLQTPETPETSEHIMQETPNYENEIKVEEDDYRQQEALQRLVRNRQRHKKFQKMLISKLNECDQINDPPIDINQKPVRNTQQSIQGINSQMVSDFRDFSDQASNYMQNQVQKSAENSQLLSQFVGNSGGMKNAFKEKDDRQSFISSLDKALITSPVSSPIPKKEVVQTSMQQLTSSLNLKTSNQKGLLSLGDSGSKPALANNSQIFKFDKSSSLENSAKKLNFNKLSVQNSESAPADSLKSQTSFKLSNLSFGDLKGGETAQKLGNKLDQISEGSKEASTPTNKHLSIAPSFAKSSDFTAKIQVENKQKPLFQGSNSNKTSLFLKPQEVKDKVQSPKAEDDIKSESKSLFDKPKDDPKSEAKSIFDKPAEENKSPPKVQVKVNLGESKLLKETSQDKAEDNLNDKYLNSTENKEEKPKEKENPPSNLFSNFGKDAPSLQGSNKPKTDQNSFFKLDNSKSTSLFGQKQTNTETPQSNVKSIFDKQTDSNSNAPKPTFSFDSKQVQQNVLGQAVSQTPKIFGGIDAAQMAQQQQAKTQDQSSQPKIFGAFGNQASTNSTPLTFSSGNTGGQSLSFLKNPVAQPTQNSMFSGFGGQQPQNPMQQQSQPMTQPSGMFSSAPQQNLAFGQGMQQNQNVGFTSFGQQAPNSGSTSFSNPGIQQSFAQPASQSSSMFKPRK